MSRRRELEQYKYHILMKHRLRYIEVTLISLIHAYLEGRLASPLDIHNGRDRQQALMWLTILMKKVCGKKNWALTLCVPMTRYSAKGCGRKGGGFFVVPNDTSLVVFISKQKKLATDLFLFRIFIAAFCSVTSIIYGFCSTCDVV